MSFDQKDFRNALGQFPTGVTVITARSKDSSPIAVTASSFNTVSLDPPLVLWSIDKSSSNLDDFLSFGYYAVNVLAEGQEAVSNNFASKGEDKFKDVEFKEGLEALPLLDNCAAQFQCKLEHEYEGGDHFILVGRVMEFENFGKAPLVFHGGKYRSLA